MLPSVGLPLEDEGLGLGSRRLLHAEGNHRHHIERREDCRQPLSALDLRGWGKVHDPRGGVVWPCRSDYENPEAPRLCIGLPLSE